MPWYDLIPTADNDQTLRRARAAIGRRTQYVLGAGGMNPKRELDRTCDCSGFVAWAIGISRQLPPGTGGWLDTDAYWKGGGTVFPNLLSRVPSGKARPGDLYVYPDYRDANGRRREGHMGIISAVDGAGVPTRVIHCSVSNSRAGDAVAETTPGPWKARADASRVMRADYDALRAKYAPGHTHEPVGDQPAVRPLKHPLLAGEASLQAIAAGGAGFLRPTSGRVPGMGAVQDALNHLAAKHPEYRVQTGAHRGFFGPKTEQAVKNFQAAHRIKPDGLVGKDTLRSLDAALVSFDANGGVDRTRTQVFAGEHVSSDDYRQAFIRMIADAARASARATGVPASVTIAQAALESNWGRSGLSVRGKNFFGIKGKGPAGSVTMPTAEYVDGRRITVNAAFRAYNSFDESCEDHAKLIAFGKWKNGIPIYGEAMKHRAEPRKFAAALEGVYATDPDYAEKLWGMMDRYRLEQYDLVDR